MPKTATKTAPPSPKSGYALPLREVGDGKGGGKKGRSGRKPEVFLAMCKAASMDPKLWKEAREKNPVAVLALSAEYSEPKPAQQHKVDATVIFKAVRE